jgi:hypothetical protein
MNTECFCSKVGCKKLLQPISSVIHPIKMPLMLTIIIKNNLSLNPVSIPSNKPIVQVIVNINNGNSNAINIFTNTYLLKDIIIGLYISLNNKIVRIYARVGASCGKTNISKLIFVINCIITKSPAKTKVKTTKGIHLQFISISYFT